jgi:hypothetical protein
VSLLRIADVPSARAEAALDRSNEVLAEFRIAWPPVVPTSASAQNIARDALLRLVTTAEMFAGEHLLDITEQQLPDEELVLRLWEERMPRILRDWPARKTAWNQLLDVEWTYTRWNELKGFTTARNIIAHGMGQLTRSQLRRGQIRQGVIDDLAAAGLTLRGYELALSDIDVERCGARVRDFIGWLDKQFVPGPSA